MNPLTREEKTIFKILLENGTLYNLPKHLAISPVVVATGNNNYILSDYERLVPYAKSMSNPVHADRCYRICALNTRSSVCQICFKLIDAVLSEKTVDEKIYKSINFTSEEKWVVKEHQLLRRIAPKCMFPRIEYFKLYAERLEKSGDMEKATLCRSIYSTFCKQASDFTEEIERLYELYFKGVPLTDEIAEQNEIDRFVLYRLLELHCLTRSDTNYKPSNPEYLLEISKKLENEGKTQEKLACYNLIGESTSDSNIILQLLEELLSRGNFDQALPTIANLKRIHKVPYLYYMYLYLLSFIVDLPPTYRSIAKSVTLEDFLLGSQVADPESDLKKTIYRQSFGVATKILNSSSDTIENRIAKSLLVEASKLQKEVIRKVVSFIEEKRARDLYELLNSERERHAITEQFAMFMSIAKDIYDYQTNETIPFRLKPRNKSLSELIRTKNYPLALERSEEIGRKSNVPQNKNEMSKLLKQACECLFPTKVEKQGESRVSQENADTFTRFLNYLRSNDVSAYSTLVQNLLLEYGMSEYYYLMEMMINISFLEKDKNFIRAVGTLIKFVKGTIIEPDEKYIDIYRILDDANAAIKERKLSVAESLLDSIMAISEHGHSCYTVEETIELLAPYRNTIIEKKQKTV